MAVSDNIKRLAKDEGFPEVRDLDRRWKDFDLYSAFDPEGPYVGLPQSLPEWPSGQYLLSQE